MRRSPTVDEIRGAATHATLEALAHFREPCRFEELLAALRPVVEPRSGVTIVVDRGRLRRTLRRLIEVGEVRRFVSGHELTPKGASRLLAKRSDMLVALKHLPSRARDRVLGRYRPRGLTGRSPASCTAADRASQEAGPVSATVTVGRRDPRLPPCRDEPGSPEESTRQAQD